MKPMAVHSPFVEKQSTVRPPPRLQGKGQDVRAAVLKVEALKRAQPGSPLDLEWLGWY
jgi:hypothetical protein